jgi:N-acylneuraminate cytidylyltransferase
VKDVGSLASAVIPDPTSVLALIPARAGSKSIQRKNLLQLAGKPLLAHTIAHALGASLIGRVIVTTDSEEIADVARSYGAEAPFRRPAEISGDFTVTHWNGCKKRRDTSRVSWSTFAQPIPYAGAIR